MRCSVLAGVGQVLVWHHKLINTSPVTGWIFHCLEQYNTAWVDMESLYFSYRYGEFIFLIQKLRPLCGIAGIDKFY